MLLVRLESKNWSVVFGVSCQSGKSLLRTISVLFTSLLHKQTGFSIKVFLQKKPRKIPWMSFMIILFVLIKNCNEDLLWVSPPPRVGILTGQNQKRPAQWSKLVKTGFYWSELVKIKTGRNSCWKWDLTFIPVCLKVIYFSSMLIF